MSEAINYYYSDTESESDCGSASESGSESEHGAECEPDPEPHPPQHDCDMSRPPDWKEEVMLSPAKLETLCLGYLISEGSAHLTPEDLTHPMMRNLEAYRSLQSPLGGWIVVGTEAKVERLDGKPIVSEVQYALGTSRLDIPEMGERVHVGEVQGGVSKELKIKVSGHYSLNWTLRWKDYSYYNDYGIFGSDKFEDGTATTEEIWRWRSYCSNLRCRRFSERHLLGSKNTLSLRDDSLVWTRTEALVWSAECREQNTMFQDLRVTWTCRARRDLRPPYSYRWL